MSISRENLYLDDDFDEEIKDRVTKVVDGIQDYVSSLEDSSPFDRTWFSGCWLGSEFILEWVNGWGRVQFFFDEDEDHLVFVDNHDKNLIPYLTFATLNMDKLSEMIVEVTEFIASFS